MTFRDATAAEALLNAAEQKLSNATTLSAKYVDTAEYQTPYRDLRQTGTVALTRTGNVKIEIDRARRVNAQDSWRDTGNRTLRVGTGEKQFSVFFHPNSTQVRQSSGATPTLPESPILAAFFAAANSPAASFRRAKADGSLANIQIENETISYTDGKVDRQIRVGPDGLIHQLTERNQKSGEIRTIQLQSIRLDEALPDKLFAYEPPKDALPYERAERQADLEIGSKAPDFTLIDAQGKTLTPDRLKGKVVILKFWATWCWPCNKSMPETDELAKKYADVGVIAVAMKDSKKGFDAWIKAHPQLRHTTFAFEDPIQSQTSKAYRVSATPTVYVIGKSGEIAAKFEGYTGPNPALEEAIKTAAGR